MKKKETNLMDKSFVRVGLATVGILLVPLIGMQVSSDWNWDASDFVIVGVLVFSTGMMIEFVRKNVRNNTHRIALIVALVLAFLYMYAELAVGIFTNLGS
jgi:Kef-type K+ transport system membrane component KefB